MGDDGDDPVWKRIIRSLLVGTGTSLSLHLILLSIKGLASHLNTPEIRKHVLLPASHVVALSPDMIRMISLDGDLATVFFKGSKPPINSVLPWFVQKDLISKGFPTSFSSSGVKLARRRVLVAALLVGLGLAYLVYQQMHKLLGDTDNAPISTTVPLRRSARPTTFADVAGHIRIKSELQQVVNLLKNPSRLRQLGARVPRGVLLEGPSGTGKTLLARATAGEAGVAFMHASASSFMEVYVGRGAKRVRELFAEARRQAPCIVFIDELDALGSARGTSGCGEYTQTVTQLLTEIDGFDPNTDAPVVVMAATNRYDALDPALVRPGRFDKVFKIGLPELNDREATLKIAARGKRLGSGVDLKRIAAETEGFSNAELEGLLNEACLLADREGQSAVSAAHISTVMTQARIRRQNRGTSNLHMLRALGMSLD